MGSKSSIEWTDATWNPVTGCTKISQGCKNCYAETFAERWRGVPGHPYENGFDLQLRPERLDVPLKWKRPRRIFVNSMSDLFHKDIPGAYIQCVFHAMGRAHWHTFQVLTKRAGLAARFSELLNWTPNIWMGVSVESAQYKFRIDQLRMTGAKVKFLSIEPLIGRIGALDLSGIDWVIVGGESGRGARPMEADWVREVRDQCQDQGVAFFFKQWGGVQKSKTGRLLDGRTWDEMPKATLDNGGRSK